MASFHNWTGDEEIDTQVPQFLNEDNAATKERLDTKFNKSLDIANASDLNNFMDEGFYCCNTNSCAETILNCPTNYAFGLMVWGKGTIVYQEVREYNRSSKNQEYNNCWRRSYYSGEDVQGTWSKWQQMSYSATTLAGYGITDGMRKDAQNSVSIPDFLKKDDEVSYLRLAGGNTFDKNATLQLYGGRHSTDAGQFLLKAANSTRSAVLSGNPSGLLKWNDKNIVRSVNNSAADDNGNVTIDVNSVIVDAELSDTSTNPVQNKVVKTNMDSLYNNLMTKLNMYRSELPTKVSDLENDAGYLTQHQSLDGYAKTSVENTWTAQQTVNFLSVYHEKYPIYIVTGTNDTPIISAMMYKATNNFTLDLGALAMKVDKSQISVFSAYFTADAGYALTITNCGTVKYIGSASDVAITSSGLLLNIMMVKDASNNLTSIVQANKLS